jgi:hypothetical protein
VCAGPEGRAILMSILSAAFAAALSYMLLHSRRASPVKRKLIGLT